MCLLYHLKLCFMTPTAFEAQFPAVMLTHLVEVFHHLTQQRQTASCDSQFEPVTWSVKVPMMQPRGYSAVCQLLPISATPSLLTNCMQKQCLREFEVPVNFEQQPGLTLFQPPCSHTSHHNTSHLCNMLSGSPCHFTSLYTSAATFTCTCSASTHRQSLHFWYPNRQV